MNPTTKEVPPDPIILPSTSWPLSHLKPHPRNTELFGSLKDSPVYESIKASIAARGVHEPVIALRDGTILSGHLRCAILGELYGKDHLVPVRIHPGFATEYETVEFMIELNAKRRQFTLEQIARLYATLKNLAPEQGGVKATRGRPSKTVDEKKVPESGTISEKGIKTRDRAARKLGVSREVLESADVVFNTPGVPADVRAAANAKKKGALTHVAKAVRAEPKSLGGAIKDPDALRRAVAETPAGQPLHKRMAKVGRELSKLLAELGKDDDESREVAADILTEIQERIGVERSGESSWGAVLGLVQDLSKKELLAHRAVLEDIAEELSEALKLAAA